MNNNIFIAALTVTAIGSSAFAQSDSPDLMDLREAIMSDAKTRTSFTDTDSPFKLSVGGFVQTRFTYNSGGGVDSNHGFGIPAARLIFSGSVYDVNYEVSGQWSDTGEFELKDAFACAGVPDSTFYRARLGKDLRYDTANKVSKAIEKLFSTTK